MRCPRCQSEKTRKIWVMESDWFLDGHRCLACGHKDYWTEFCDSGMRDVGRMIRNWKAA